MQKNQQKKNTNIIFIILLGILIAGVIGWIIWTLVAIPSGANTPAANCTSKSCTAY
jgi:hypothetical protein